ncbi:hypothetical protein HK102_011281, partial [Quaeritorhiza haematococci]
HTTTHAAPTHAASTPAKTDPTDAIVGGEPVGSVDALPWVVTLRSPRSGHFCGASLISKNLMLTAAHCTDAFSSFGSTTDIIASAFRYDQKQKTPSEGGIDFSIKDVIKHPSWNRDVISGSDIALLVVEIKNNTQNRPIPFIGVTKTPASAEPSEQFKGVNATLAGWGRLSHGGPLSQYLMQVDVPVLSTEQCKSHYEGRLKDSINDKLICVGIPEKKMSACHGDSGGPLFTVEDGTPVLHGVTSWGGVCGKTPTLYTRIAAYLDWLLPLIKEHNRV